LLWGFTVEATIAAPDEFVDQVSRAVVVGKCVGKAVRETTIISDPPIIDRLAAGK